jgi:hypothetical protein
LTRGARARPRARALGAQVALLRAELEEAEARIDAICDRYGWKRDGLSAATAAAAHARAAEPLAIAPSSPAAPPQFAAVQPPPRAEPVVAAGLAGLNGPVAPPAPTPAQPAARDPSALLSGSDLTDDDDDDNDDGESDDDELERAAAAHEAGEGASSRLDEEQREAVVTPEPSPSSVHGLLRTDRYGASSLPARAHADVAPGDARQRDSSRERADDEHDAEDADDGGEPSRARGYSHRAAEPPSLDAAALQPATAGDDASALQPSAVGAAHERREPAARDADSASAAAAALAAHAAAATHNGLPGDGGTRDAEPAGAPPAPPQVSAASTAMAARIAQLKAKYAPLAPEPAVAQAPELSPPPQADLRTALGAGAASDEDSASDDEPREPSASSPPVVLSRPSEVENPIERLRAQIETLEDEMQDMVDAENLDAASQIDEQLEGLRERLAKLEADVKR